MTATVEGRFAVIRVLIVDDSITMRAMLANVLHADPELRTVMAESVQEAEGLLGADHFDVITLDNEMPGMTGLQYLATLLKRSDVPVVMLSSGTAKGTDLRIAALRAGAAGCFDKAEAIRRSADLIKLVKSAAHHKARIDRDDAAALRDAIKSESGAA